MINVDSSPCAGSAGEYEPDQSLLDAFESLIQEFGAPVEGV